MKIYKKLEFLKLPEGTLFQFGPDSVDALSVAQSGINVKHATRNDDFTYTPIIDVDCGGSEELFELSDVRVKQAWRDGASEDIPADFEASRSEGLYSNVSDLYVVFEPNEIRAIITVLQALI